MVQTNKKIRDATRVLQAERTYVHEKRLACSLDIFAKLEARMGGGLLQIDAMHSP
jgi:hypothetical protein